MFSCHHSLTRSTTADPDAPVRSVGRRAYARTPTQLIEPPPRDEDAPVPLDRHGARLQPSAPLLAANARAEALDDEVLHRDLIDVLGERIDDSDELEVLTLGAVVVLHGRVSSELDKLLAEDLAFTFGHVRHCRNELRVAPAPTADAA